MLTFESPFYEIEGVVVFRDHASLTTFHYLAGPPRLSRSPDGKPNLLLLKYRNALDAMGTPRRGRASNWEAHFCCSVWIVECLRKPRMRSRASCSRELPPDAGPVNLVPVLYTKGKVSVVALDKQKASGGRSGRGSGAAEQVRAGDSRHVHSIAPAGPTGDLLDFPHAGRGDLDRGSL